MSATLLLSVTEYWRWMHMQLAMKTFMSLKLRLQPHQIQAQGEKCRTEGNNQCPWTVWGKHNHAAITQNGVLHHHAILGPYNTTHMVTFLNAIHNMLVSDPNPVPEHARFVVIWDNDSFPGCSGPKLVCYPSTVLSTYPHIHLF